MPASPPTDRQSSEPRKTSSPPGRTRIMEALKSLLAEKEFTAITVAQIAQRAQVTEPLIYKYFKDKRDLLNRVLQDYIERDLAVLEEGMGGVRGAKNKLRRAVWIHVNMYASDRVLARIILLEVRNYPDYFKSEAYEAVKRYANGMLTIIEEGAAEGEIRSDISPTTIRQLVLGAIEHAVLPGVIFGREIDPDEIAEDLCEMLLNGISD